MNIPTTEMMIWALIWCVAFYFTLLLIIDFLARVRDFVTPLSMREVDTIIRRHKETCALSVEGTKCERGSQHLRHVGGLYTPRLKQWVVVCPKHLYVPISRKEAKELIRGIK